MITYYHNVTWYTIVNVIWSTFVPTHIIGNYQFDVLTCLWIIKKQFLVVFYVVLMHYCCLNLHWYSYLHLTCCNLAHNFTYDTLPPGDVVSKIGRVWLIKECSGMNTIGTTNSIMKLTQDSIYIQVVTKCVYVPFSLDVSFLHGRSGKFYFVMLIIVTFIGNFACHSYYLVT